MSQTRAVDQRRIQAECSKDINPSQIISGNAALTTHNLSFLQGRAHTNHSAEMTEHKEEKLSHFSHQGPLHLAANHLPLLGLRSPF
jgi:hypothetical protein